MSNLQKALQRYDRQIVKTGQPIPGEIGITIDGSRVTEVPGRGQFVYVRLRSNLSEVIQAFNDTVFPGYGIPVIVEWRNNRYEVTGKDNQRYPEWESGKPFIARHGETHSLDKDGGRIGTDPVWVYPYQIIPALVSPFNVAGVQNAYIHPHQVEYRGAWTYQGNTGTPSFAPYKPASGTSLVMVTMDYVTGNPSLFATTGTYIPTSITGSPQFVPYFPEIDRNRYNPLAIIRLESGTSQIGWDEIWDIRQFTSRVPTNEVNGQTGIDTFQFTNVTFSSTGTVAFIETVGGGGSTTGSSYPILFDIEGTLETGTSSSQPYLVPGTYYATKAYLYCEDRGITGSTVVDVQKNGVSIFTGSPLTLPYSSTGSWVSLTPYLYEFVSGDVLTTNIVQKATNAKNAKILITSSTGVGGSLTVKEVDGNPSVAGITTIVFPNGSVTNDGGGQATIRLSDELDYVEFTSNVLPTATTEGAANTVVTGSTISFDGSTTIMIEFFSWGSRPDSSGAGRTLTLYLFEDGVSVGLIGFMNTPAAGFDNKPLHLFRRRTPSAGNHTYSIRASVSTGTGLVGAGVGGSGNAVPGFIRIRKV